MGGGLLPLSAAPLIVAIAATSQPAQSSNAALGDAFLAGGPKNSRHDVAQFYPGLVPERKIDEWNDFDLKNYVHNHWHPGAPTEMIRRASQREWTRDDSAGELFWTRVTQVASRVNAAPAVSARPTRNNQARYETARSARSRKDRHREIGWSGGRV